MSLTLGSVKSHLPVTHNDDDALIQSYIDAATAHAERYLRVSFAADFAGVVPAPVEIAIMQHVAVLYENRSGDEGGEDVSLPAGYRTMMSTYRNLA